MSFLDVDLSSICVFLYDKPEINDNILNLKFRCHKLKI